MMAGMKQSGVFGAANQVAMSKQSAAGAKAGGMATSELTGMANIGSQISRMVGGTGAAGAAAGISTLTSIGVAQQMGILSEEDIYNQTGETGAMGRRSMAVSGMERAARFYKSGMGRRMLASMAGKDGRLDEGDADEIAGGGVGVGRAREMWQENMKGVGQANFIRNEGRLRGEALKRFGAMGPAMWMKQLMEQKGIDVNEDNDKAMLFLQRRMKMGRDEASNELKLIQNLPAIQREQNISSKAAAAEQKYSNREKLAGLEGLKHKFDKAVDGVSSSIQQLGADAMEGLSEQFESIINWVTDTRVKNFDKSAARAQAGLRGGGAKAREAFDAAFGGGGGGLHAGVAGLARGVGARDTRSDTEIGRGLIAEKLGFGASFSNDFEADRELLGKKGYKVEEGLSRAATNTKLDELRTFSDAAGGQGVDLALGTGATETLQSAYRGVAGMGLERAASLERVLLESDNPELKSIGEKLKKASGKEKGDLVAGIGRAAGRENEGQMFAMPDSVGVYDSTKYYTKDEQAAAIGKAFMGVRAGTSNAPSFMESVWDLLGKHEDTNRQLRDGSFEEEEGKGIGSAAVKAMGAFANSPEGKGLLAGALSRNSGKANDTAKKMQTQITELEQRRDSKPSEFSATEKGTLEFLKKVRATKRVLAAGGDEKKLEAIAKEEGYTDVDELKSVASGVGAVATEQENDRLLQLQGTDSKKSIDALVKGGLIKDGKLVEGKFEEGAEKDFMEAMISGDTTMAGITEGSTVLQKEAARDAYAASQGKMDTASLGMSVSQKRTLAKKLREGGSSEQAGYLSSRAATQERLERGPKSQRMRNLTGMLGSDLSREDITSALGSDTTSPEGMAAGTEALTAKIAESMGGLGKESTAMIKEAVAHQRAGDSSKAEEALRGLGSQKDYVEGREKKEKEKQEKANPLQAEGNRTLVAIKDALNTKLDLIADNTKKPVKDSEETAGGWLG